VRVEPAWARSVASFRLLKFTPPHGLAQSENVQIEAKMASQATSLLAEECKAAVKRSGKLSDTQ